jgi:hypothetical protein
MIATLGVMFAGMLGMVRSEQGGGAIEPLMRWRVILQFVTIAAVPAAAGRDADLTWERSRRGSPTRCWNRAGDLSGPGRRRMFTADFDHVLAAANCIRRRHPAPRQAPGIR